MAKLSLDLDLLDNDSRGEIKAVLMKAEGRVISEIKEHKQTVTTCSAILKDLEAQFSTTCNKMGNVRERLEKAIKRSTMLGKTLKKAGF